MHGNNRYINLNTTTNVKTIHRRQTITQEGGYFKERNEISLLLWLAPSTNLFFKKIILIRASVPPFIGTSGWSKTLRPTKINKLFLINQELKRDARARFLFIFFLYPNFSGRYLIKEENSQFAEKNEWMNNSSLTTNLEENLSITKFSHSFAEKIFHFQISFRWLDTPTDSIVLVEIN